MANYLKNSDLLREIILSKENQKLSSQALKYIQLMTDKIALEFRYKTREDLEDCKSFAILNVLTYWNRFDENITTNAFSYYTELIKSGYGLGFNKLHKKNMQTISISSIENINI